VILYRLKCAQQHEFDGWFRNSDSFERQAEAGDVACAICGDTDVKRAPMAPNIGRGAVPRLSPATEAVPSDSDSPKQGQVIMGNGGGCAAATGLPPEQQAELRRLLTGLRQHVESNCAYVGDRFAEEARKIHYGETAPQPIYGEASRGEAESLVDEGIDIAQIPWLRRDDA